MGGWAVEFPGLEAVPYPGNRVNRGIEAIRYTNGDVAEASRIEAAVLRILTGEWVSTTKGTRAKWLY